MKNKELKKNLEIKEKKVNQNNSYKEITIEKTQLNKGKH